MQFTPIFLAQMLTRYLAVSLLALVGATSVAHSACLKGMEVDRLKPDVGSHKEDVGQSDGSIVSIYRQQGSKRFVEIVRKNRCISSAKILSAGEVDQKYDLMASLWDERAAAQEEGLDNEGMPEEGDEAANAIDPALMFPFLSFDKFGVTSVYSGRVASPQFDGRDRQFADFRARITASMKQGVNFSGEYAITEIGCGSSCTIAILSNLRTGQQFKFPYGGEEVGPIQLKYSARSRLLIATRREGDECILESMVFDGAKWTALAKSSIGDSDVCYEPIEENIANYKAGLGANANGKPLEPKGSGAASKSTATGEALPAISDAKSKDIYASTLKDLYGGYSGIKVCYEARRGRIPVYISEAEMAKVKATIEGYEAELMRRAPSIDKKRLWAEEQQFTNATMMSVVIEGQLRYNSKTYESCRLMLSLLPKDFDTVLQHRSALPREAPPRQGLIVPQDPRFR